MTTPPKPGDPCPAGCAEAVPPHTPDRLRENEDGEVSCPSCWDVFAIAQHPRAKTSETSV